MGWIKIDVNGAKGPNIYGRDLFYFFLGENGTLYPVCGIDFAIYYDDGCKYDDLKSCDSYWNNDIKSYCACPNGAGYGCTARIMEDGWQMNY